MLRKNARKKKGFTLLEIGAVLGIIMLLIGFFVPRISGYVKDSKEVGIMAQAKTVIFAWETINNKEGKNLKKETPKSELISVAGDKYGDYFDLKKTTKLKETIKITECMDIVDGRKFTIDSSGIFEGFADESSGSSRKN
ncbi:type II secretion system protein [uncultured Clostridium sp.]|uniref:type II secretion system protein n=1 Tax=uncultured Clostridium sp. TaxID=59620 RepID=UPI002619E63B|nr:type II secretion system protein [uncultured Clostridium sp.]